MTTTSTSSAATFPIADDASSAAESPIVCRSSDVVRRELEWLWPDRVPLGKLTLLVGDPEQGKSFLTLDMAARVTRGLAWPEKRRAGRAPQPAPMGSVVILTAEDQADDTVVPRLIEAGADLDKCLLLQAARTVEGLARPLSLDRDLGLVRRTLLNVPDCRLVVIDPISSYLGQVDGNSNTNLRSLLFPLSELAAERGVAVVMVSHLNKRAGARAMYRTTGSMAFVAVSRAAWLVVRDPQDDQRRLLLSIKNNLAAPPPALAFRLASRKNQSIAHVEWDAEPVEQSLADALGQRAAFNWKEQAYRDRESWAVTWLREQLSNGAIGRTSLWMQAMCEDVSKDQMYRAAKRLGVVIRKKGMSWNDAEWSLPDPANHDRADHEPQSTDDFDDLDEAFDTDEFAPEPEPAAPPPRSRRASSIEPRPKKRRSKEPATNKPASKKPASKNSVKSVRAKASKRLGPRATS